MTDVIAIQMQYTIHHCLKMTETNFKKTYVIISQELIPPIVL